MIKQGAIPCVTLNLIQGLWSPKALFFPRNPWIPDQVRDDTKENFVFAMKKKIYKTKSKLWIYPGDAAWHFVSVPEKEATIIKKAHGSNARGFGSLPVEVTIGKTTWKTSIFPDNRSGIYLLPVKKKVRETEELLEGDTISISFSIQ